MEKRMNKYNVFLAVVILPVIFFGCAGVSTETKAKCPKCGAILAMTTFPLAPAIFTTDERLLEGSVGWKKSR